MRICEKISMEREGLEKYGPITIVAFGDSVTHGAVSENEINYETVYWNRLRQKILQIRNYVPVNVINAGIGGSSAIDSVSRMDQQVLAHNPDLIIICFGLNDVNAELKDYLAALREIFQKSLNSGAETIFMTPNMLNTHVIEERTPKEFLQYAFATAKMQSNGRMDTYMREAVALAKEMGVMVCDCYTKWKELSKTQDTTLLLANGINHPTKEMHELFASSLFEVLFHDQPELSAKSNNTMYSESE